MRVQLFFSDHILYRRAHFVCDAMCVSRAMLAVIVLENYVVGP